MKSHNKGPSCREDLGRLKHGVDQPYTLGGTEMHSELGDIRVGPRLQVTMAGKELGK